MGKGAAAPQSTQYITDKGPTTPVVQLDHHYLKDDGEEAIGVEDRFSTTLAFVDVDTAAAIQLSLPTKGGNQDYANGAAAQ